MEEPADSLDQLEVGGGQSDTSWSIDPGFVGLNSSRGQVGEPAAT